VPSWERDDARSLVTAWMGDARSGRSLPQGGRSVKRRSTSTAIAYYPSMYNAATLLDIHARAHESLRRLIAFCDQLTDSELRRPVTGFGFPTVIEQLEHTIGAEVYWQTVVARGYTEEATLPDLPDMAAIEAFRARTASVTRSYLERGATRN
jgi:hypothetical protein